MYKSRYFAVTEFNDRLINRSTSYRHYSHKSLVTITHEQNTVGDITHEGIIFVGSYPGFASQVGVLLKAGPRPTAHGPRPTAHGPRPTAHGPPRPGGPKAQRPAAHGGPVLIFHGVQNGLRWFQFSVIFIIISVLFNPFFRCLLLSGKRRHSLFIRSSSVYLPF